MQILLLFSSRRLRISGNSACHVYNTFSIAASKSSIAHARNRGVASDVILLVVVALWLVLISYAKEPRAELKVTEPNLRFPAVFCENLRFSAKIFGLLRFSAPSKSLSLQEKG